MTPNRRRRSLLAVGAVLLLIAAGCSGDDAEDAIDAAPTATDVVEGEPTPDVATEVVRFTTDDGEQLEATVYGDGPRGVVLAHMRSRDRSTWDGFARAAAAEGLHVLAFDFRGYGGSSGERDTALDTDILAAVSAILGVSRRSALGSEARFRNNTIRSSAPKSCISRRNCSATS